MAGKESEIIEKRQKEKQKMMELDSESEKENEQLKKKFDELLGSDRSEEEEYNDAAEICMKETNRRISQNMQNGSLSENKQIQLLESKKEGRGLSRKVREEADLWTEQENKNYQKVYDDFDIKKKKKIRVNKNKYFKINESDESSTQEDVVSEEDENNEMKREKKESIEISKKLSTTEKEEHENEKLRKDCDFNDQILEKKQVNKHKSSNKNEEKGEKMTRDTNVKEKQVEREEVSRKEEKEMKEQIEIKEGNKLITLHQNYTDTSFAFDSPLKLCDIKANEEKRKRLMIVKIVLNNFKSYGGRKVIGPFHKRFTCIVGPNGSGKSNVIDALLFVFGKKGKKIRTSKLNELIHNSANAHLIPNFNNLQSTYVEVHFQDIIDNTSNDEYTVVPNSEFVVSREAFADGNSKFKVNGVCQTQKYVTCLLKDRGIDLDHNRFLILQGEVEQIAQMKPKALKPDEEGLLEYLEDIIGSNQYLNLIKETADTYQQLTTVYHEKLNRLRVTQKELEQLEEPCREAQQLILCEKECLDLQIKLKTKDKNEYEQVYKEKQEKLIILEEDKKKADEETNKLELQRNALVRKLDLYEKDLSKLLHTHQKKEEEFKNLESLDEDLRNESAATLKRIEKYTKQLEKFRQKMPENLEKSKKKEEEASHVELLMASAENTLEVAEKRLEEMLESIKDELSECSANLSKEEAILAPLQQELDEKNKELSKMEIEQKLIKKRKENLQTEFENIKNKMNNYKSEVQAKNSMLNDIAAQVKKKKNELLECSKRIDMIKKEIEETNQNYSKHQIAYEEMRSLYENNNKGNFQQQILNEIKSEGIQGVHGIVHQLADIDSKYELAYTVATSMSDFLVVDSPDVAHKIFELSRRKDLGRIHIVALSELSESERNMNKPFNLPALNTSFDSSLEVIRLFDLIKPKQEIYRKVFYRAVGNTLLSQNLDMATQIAYSTNSRVVSMQGELIEIDGRMSGGGMKNKRHSKLVDISKMEEEKQLMINCGKKLQNLKSDRNDLNKTYERLSIIINKDENDIACLQVDIQDFSVQISEMEKRLENYVEIKMTEEELIKFDKLSKAIEKFKALKNVAERKVKNQEEQVKNLREAFESIGGDEIQKAKQKKESAEKKIKEIRETVERLRLESMCAKSEHKKCQIEIEKYQKELKELNEIQEHVTQKMDKLEEEAAEKLQEKEEIEHFIQEKQMEVAKAKEEKEVIDKDISQMGLDGVDLQHKIEDYKKELMSIKNRIDSSKQKIESFKQTYLSLPNMQFLQFYNANDHITSSFKQSNLPSINKENKEVDENAQDNTLESSSAFFPLDKTIENVTEKNDLFEEISSEDIDKLNREELESKIAQLTNDLSYKELNVRVVQEFERVFKEFQAKQSALQIAFKSREEAKHNYDAICAKRKFEFLRGFKIIAAKLKEMYQMITQGGDAELELLDISDPFNEGVIFSVRPPKKSWRKIFNLSGGEKTLSSLALVFALHDYQPTPVYFMDEIDAALDFRNVSIMAHYIKERTKDAQFIVISLRNQMFELCNRMVGIYKTYDITKSVCIDPDKFSEKATEHIDKKNDEEGKSDAMSLEIPPN